MTACTSYMRSTDSVSPAAGANSERMVASTYRSSGTDATTVRPSSTNCTRTVSGNPSSAGRKTARLSGAEQATIRPNSTMPTHRPTRRPIVYGYRPIWELDLAPGQRPTANGQRPTGNGQRPTASGQRSAVSAQRTTMPRILIIDDDDAVRATTERTLRSAGFTVQTARSGEEGFNAARGNGFDVILSDMRMPGESGLDVLRKLRELRVDSAFIIMTGFGTVETAVEAMKLGAVDFVQKPFFRDELLMRIRSAADRRGLARQVDLLQRQIRASGPVDTLIGDSEPMRKIK